MAKKVTGYIKLQIPAAKATPAPPVGPALGQHGVNIPQFTKEFNARTADQEGMIIPVVWTKSRMCRSNPLIVLNIRRRHRYRSTLYRLLHYSNRTTP